MKKTKDLLIHYFLFFAAALNVCTSHSVEVSPLIGVGQEDFSFEIVNFTDDKKTVKFQPNIPGLVSLGVNAYGFGIGYSIRGSRVDTSSQQTPTDFSDWQLSYNSKNWGLEAYYQKYKGFDTNNTNAIQKYPELRFTHVGFLARGSIGEQEQEFSLAALMNQSANITSTSWKAFWVFGYNEYVMQSDTSLLQQENEGLDMPLENLRGLNSSIIKAGFGAGKYWVSDKHFFIGGLVDSQFSHSNYSFKSTTGSSTASDSNTDLTANLNIRLAFGYAGSPFRIGSSFASNTSMLKTPGKGYLRPSSNRFQIYVRYISEF